MNMLDLLRSAQGGNGIENLARQFGLGHDDTEKVLRQVLPAVSTGFKQKTRNEGGLAGILRGIQGTDYEDVYDDPNALLRDDIRARGDSVLAEIFGDKEVSRSVARRTEQNSGVGADLVKKMLPVITSMVMGGMQKRATTDAGVNSGVGDLLTGLLGGGGAPKPASGGGGLDDIIGSVLGQKRPQPQPQRRKPSGGMGGILGGLLRGRRPAAQPTRRASPQADNLDDLLGGIFGAQPRQRKSTGDPRLDSVIGMFDANGDGEVDMDVLRQLAKRR